MDQVKIGQFIKECRLAKNMTQEQLAEKLFVTAKTISKWEVGKGLPDVSIMYNLCNQLDITLKELFLGEHLEDKSNDEHLLAELYEQEARNNKTTLRATMFIGIILIVLLFGVIIGAGFLPVNDSIKEIICVSAVIVLILSIIPLAAIDCKVGYFECPNCHERFVPTMSQYIFGIHTGETRRLKCPKCGEKHWCKKKFSKKDLKSEK